MIVLSTQSGFALALSSVLAEPGLPPVAGPFHCRRLDQAEDHIPANRDHLVTVDLGSRDYHPDVEEFVQEWRRVRPATGFIFVSPGTWGFERHLVAVLGRGAEVLCGEEYLQAAVWASVLQSGIAGPLLGELWYDLHSAVEALDRKIQYDTEVLSVMEAAPRVRVVEDYTKRHLVERRKLSSRIKRAFTARTRAQLYAFRLMWLLKLREEGWQPWETARFLGYENSTEAGRAMRRFWGVGMRDLDTVPYQVIVRATAEWLTEPRGLIARLLSVRDLRSTVQSAVSSASPGSSSPPAS